MLSGPVTCQALDLPTGDAQRWREKLYRILEDWFYPAAQAAAWREGHLRPLTPRVAECARAPTEPLAADGYRCAHSGFAIKRG